MALTDIDPRVRTVIYALTPFGVCALMVLGYLSPGQALQWITTILGLVGGAGVSALAIANVPKNPS